jgi:hypothetical protein
MNHTHSTVDEAATKPFATKRHDSWWVEPLLVAVGFGLFIIYATYRAFQNQYFEVDNYISPFYSPKLAFDWWKWSPAILILWIPAGFRATCYYYRKAYYRAYFLDPPGCAVGHFGGHNYTGETSFRLGWGSVVYFVNVVLLSNYTLGCHVFRHLVGGKLDCFTCPNGKPKPQYGAWKFVTKLNEHHMFWAWLSLFSVGIADAYTMWVVQNRVDDTIFGPSLPWHHFQ